MDEDNGCHVLSTEDQGTHWGKGDLAVSQRSKLGETKIDWVFGTVDHYILYID
jgi:hypothetical protein